MPKTVNKEIRRLSFKARVLQEAADPAGLDRLFDFFEKPYSGPLGAASRRRSKVDHHALRRH